MRYLTFDTVPKIVSPKLLIADVFIGAKLNAFETSGKRTG